MASAHYVSTSCLTLDEADRIIYASIDIATATLGFCGSLYVILTTTAHNNEVGGAKNRKRRRVQANHVIVLCLAISTLFACTCVLAKSIQLLAIEQPNTSVYPGHTVSSKHWYRYIDIPISFLGTFFYISTFMWTFCYALDIYLQLRDKNVPHRSYHVLCWGFAGILSGLQIVLSHFATHPPYPYCLLPSDHALAKYLSFYVTIAVVMVSLPVLFLLSLAEIRRAQMGRGRFTENERKVLRAIAWKFFFIVMIFVYGWCANFVNGFYMVIKTEDKWDSPFVFYVLEALSNPMQGFFNAFVFGKHEVAKRWIRSCISKRFRRRRTNINIDSEFYNSDELLRSTVEDSEP
ncbi:cyclic AMP receptor-like protein A [Oscarella lobularis]|uniref:cyclic AMP receptor-like protein A n=1 Tax=Oscarella lobularis TaxID=121494 RepID=UPI0033140C80